MSAMAHRRAIGARSRACSTVARTRTVTRYVVSKPRIVRRASFVLFPFFSDIVVSFSVLFRSLFLCLLARRILRSFGVVSRDDRVCWIILAWSSHLRHYFVRKDSSLFLSSCWYYFSLNDGFSRLLFFSLLYPNPTSVRTSTA